MHAPDHATLEAYERWAPTYPPVPHNPLMKAEQRAMLAHWPQMAGRRALDLACGSGRYARLLVSTGAAMVTALDFSTAMLSQVSGCLRVRGSMMRLPFANGAFDVVVSGLAVGHASDIRHWMHEVSRVLSPGGVLLYSDFHPQAARAGLTRSFKDEQGVRCVVPHNTFEVAVQTEAATAAGLVIESIAELRAGAEVNEPFSGSEQFYRQLHDLPLVWVARARKC